ncbi:hypothetical protein ACFY2K_42620 [Kitasatospora sp. NPDC001309]|uniref:hypothetical protein n=1 Tax=Kitasatospora sp. NPDC001309 TaxID=3364013 RepID=UPI0036B12AA9
MDDTTREALRAYAMLRTALAVVALDPERRAVATAYEEPLQVLANEANAKMRAAGLIVGDGQLTVTPQQVEQMVRDAGLQSL